MYQRKKQGDAEVEACVGCCYLFFFMLLLLTLATQCYKPVCYFDALETQTSQSLHSFSEDLWSILPFNKITTLLIAQFFIVLFPFYLVALCANKAKLALSLIFIFLVIGLIVHFIASQFSAQLAQALQKALDKMLNQSSKTFLGLMLVILVVAGYFSKPVYNVLSWVYSIVLLLLIVGVFLPQSLISGIRSYYQQFLIHILKLIFSHNYDNYNQYSSNMAEKVDLDHIDDL